MVLLPLYLQQKDLNLTIADDIYFILKGWSFSNVSGLRFNLSKCEIICLNENEANDIENIEEIFFI